MEKLSINNVSKNFFKTTQAKSQKVENNQTNPFGVSFKGNVLTADVFDTKKNSRISFTGAGTNLISRISEKSKMLRAAALSVNNVIGTRLNTIVNHGRKMGERVSNLWKQAQSIEININPKAIIEGSEELIINAKNSIKSSWRSLTDNNNNLRALPVDDLATRLEAKLATIGGV